jgi:RNA polymerase sigma-70 factor (ECF subfamily)
MEPQNSSRQLSTIETSWSTIYQAHQGEGDAATEARRRLLLRYYHPIFRYLRATVRDADAAQELTHEFVVRFLRGDFRRANPSRGRFRDLLKQALRRLAIDYWRRKRLEKERNTYALREDGTGTSAGDDCRLRPLSADPDLAEADWSRSPPPRRRTALPGSDAAAAFDVNIAEADRTFLQGWRAEMLAQAWDALARLQERTGCPYFTVLRLRVDHAEGCGADLTRLVAARLGKPLSEPAFRQLLRRARDKFADFLVAAVAFTLGDSDPEAVEEELIELNLLSYCRRSVARLRQSNSLPHSGGPAR